MDALADTCVLGPNFIAHFKLNIRLFENALVMDNSIIPIQVPAMPTDV